MSKRIYSYSTLVDHASGDANDGAVALHVAQHHRSGPDAGVGADGDGTQHLGARPYNHVFREGGVPFAVVFARAPQGYPLVEQATVANLGGFANHYPHAMVNEDALADASAGVDLDAG